MSVSERIGIYITQNVLHVGYIIIVLVSHAPNF